MGLPPQRGCFTIFLPLLFVLEINIDDPDYGVENHLGFNDLKQEINSVGKPFLRVGKV